MEADIMKTQSMPEEDLNAYQSTVRWGRRHAAFDELRGHYPFYKRAQEVTATYSGLLLLTWTGYLLLFRLESNQIPEIICGWMLGMLFDDFLSGCLHFASDTYGSPETPLIGPALLAPFRVHHIDPTLITRLDFVENNGDDITLTLIPLYWLGHKLLAKNISTLFAWFVFSACFNIVLTNEYHKWAHTYYGLPLWIRTLQNLHIILPRNHHRTHHVSPHDCYYCITTGWLNVPLEKIRFWRGVEAVVYFLFNVKPRVDDQKWTHHIKEE